MISSKQYINVFLLFFSVIVVLNSTTSASSNIHDRALSETEELCKNLDTLVYLMDLKADEKKQSFENARTAWEKLKIIFCSTNMYPELMKKACDHISKKFDDLSHKNHTDRRAGAIEIRTMIEQLTLNMQQKTAAICKDSENFNIQSYLSDYTISKQELIVTTPSNEDAWSLDVKTFETYIESLEKTLPPLSNLELIIDSDNIFIRKKGLIAFCQNLLAELKPSLVNWLHSILVPADAINYTSELAIRKTLKKEYDRLQIIQKKIEEIIFYHLQKTQEDSATIIKDFEFLKDAKLEKIPYEQKTAYAWLREVQYKAAECFVVYKKLLEKYKDLNAIAKNMDIFRVEKELKQLIAQFNTPILFTDLCKSRVSFKDFINAVDVPADALWKHKPVIGTAGTIVNQYVINPTQTFVNKNVLSPSFNKVGSVLEKIDKASNGTLEKSSKFLTNIETKSSNLINTTNQMPNAAIWAPGIALQYLHESKMVEIGAWLASFDWPYDLVQKITPGLGLRLKWWVDFGLTPEQALLLARAYINASPVGEACFKILEQKMQKKPEVIKAYFTTLLSFIKTVANKADIKVNTAKKLLNKKLSEYEDLTKTYVLWASVNGSPLPTREHTAIDVAKKIMSIQKPSITIASIDLLKQLSAQPYPKEIENIIFDSAQKAADKSEALQLNITKATYSPNQKTREEIRDTYFVQAFTNKLQKKELALQKKANGVKNPFFSTQEKYSKLLENTRRKRTTLANSMHWYNYLWVPRFIDYRKKITALESEEQWWSFHVASELESRLQKIEEERQKITISPAWYHYLWLPSICTLARKSALEKNKTVFSIQAEWLTKQKKTLQEHSDVYVKYPLLTQANALATIRKTWQEKYAIPVAQ